MRKRIPRWTFTRSRHCNALVFSLAGSWIDGTNHYSDPSLRGWTVTLGLGLWSFHAAYRKEARDGG